MTIELNKTVTTFVATAPNVTAVAPNTELSADTFQSMLNILQQVADHTHIFYDDYTTACNCNCACACSRGIL